MEASSAPSFVTAVLATAGRLDKDDLSTKLGQLARKIEEVKMEVHDALMQKYAEFFPLFDATKELRSRVTDLRDGIDTQLASIEKQIKAQLQVSSSDYDGLQQRCSECSATLNLLVQLLKISDGFQQIENLTAAKNYEQATRINGSLCDVLSGIYNTHGNDLVVFPHLCQKRAALEENLKTCVMGRWAELITWSNSSSVLTIASGPDSHQVLEQLSQSLHNLGLLSTVISKFSGQVMTNIVSKLLSSESSCNLEIKQDIVTNSVSFKVIARMDSAFTTHTVQKLNVFTTMMESLYSNLLDINVVNDISSRDTGDAVLAAKDKKAIDVKSCRSLMSVFGAECSAACLQALINNCLSAAIPSTRSELAGFTKVVTVVEELQSKLVRFGFISEENGTLVEYVKNVDSLFANKRCVQLLDEARKLIKSDIHNIVQVSEDLTNALAFTPLVPNTSSSSSSKKLKPTEEVADVKLDALFTFPQCYISVMAQKLVDLAISVLREAVTTYHSNDISSDGLTENIENSDGMMSGEGRETSVQLLYTARNMFEMFASLVPVYHRQLLATLPQLAAIHHNDCMYVAHHLMLLGHQFKLDLPPLTTTATTTPLSSVTFIDLVPVLRRSGTRCFMEQMSTQRTQLIQSLGIAHGFVALTDGDNYDSVQRAISQVIHQLRHLVSVWKNVLPAHIYAKSLGTLTNSVVSELVTKILSLEDIPEDDAHSLSGLLSKFCDQVERDVITPVSLVHELPLAKLVPSWARLHETRFLLSARLHEISDRWSDGPLAAEMTAGEVKHVIRALFENNDRRSATLAAIK